MVLLILIGTILLLLASKTKYLLPVITLSLVVLLSGCIQPQKTVSFSYSYYDSDGKRNVGKFSVSYPDTW